MANSEQISGSTVPKRRRIGLATILVDGVTLLLLIAVGVVLTLLVTVGNIGSKNRVNYTVVGNAENSAARIYSLAKEIATEEDCIILTSGDTRDHAGTKDTDIYELKNLGEREIRRREGIVSIFQLDAKATSS